MDTIKELNKVADELYLAINTLPEKQRKKLMTIHCKLDGVIDTHTIQENKKDVELKKLVRQPMLGYQLTGETISLTI